MTSATSTPNFLRDVARYFATGAPGQPRHEDIVYVLPNKRGAMFLKKHIQAIMTKPGRMPRLMTMRSFLSMMAGYPEASERARIFMLYDAYRTVMQRRGAEEAVRPFDSFVFWGDMIAGDFDEIDRSMVSADEIFCNLKRIKEIQADYLTEDQKEIVRRIWGESRLTSHTEQFWLHIKNEDSETALAHKFVYLWEILAEVYHQYKAILHSKGLVSTGDSYRLAVEKVKQWESGTLPAHTHYAFVGFNDAGIAETLIFQRLKDLGIASFMWDTAPLALFGENAGRPLRRLSQLIRAFPAPEGFESKALEPKDITVDAYAVPSQILQAKSAGAELAKWCEGGFADPANPINTAAVLPDQTLLLPLMFSLPEAIQKVNVSMGLPYRSTTFAALLHNIVSMQLRARKLRGKYHFYFEDVSAVLLHPHMRYIDSDACEAVIAQIKEKKLYNIDAAQLVREHEVLASVFTPVHDLKDVGSVANYLTGLFQWLSSSLEKDASAPKAEKFEQKVLEYLSRSVEALAELAREYRIDMADRTFLRLFERMLNHTDVPAMGTPLEGLQILGVLETRTLDFDNTAVLSMNERIFPRRQYTRTMIPGTLRAGYGLPAPDSLENTYAYCFFRLVARSRRLALYYDSRSGQEGSGEMSRYISQLSYLVPGLDVVHHRMSLGAENPVSATITITKTPEVMAQVNQLRPGGDLRLSASALKEYKRCKLAFYLKYLRRLRGNDEVVDYMNSADHGTLVHNVIQNAFKDFGSNPITATMLTQLVAPDNKTLDTLAVTEVIKHKYYEYAGTPSELPAEGRLAAEIIALIARSDIEAERDAYCSNGNTFVFRKAEEQVDGPWTIAPGLTVNWFMSIDRVDICSDGSLRFIDFKTGSDEMTVDKVDSLQNYNHKKEGIFQVLTYCQAYRDLIDPTARIKPIIHSTRELSRALGLKNLKVGKEAVESYGGELANKFEPIVKNIIASIFDTGTPFDQCENLDNCRYCEFKDTCGRYPATDY